MSGLISRREVRIAAMQAIFAAINNDESGEVLLERLQESSDNDRIAAALSDDMTANLVRVFDLRRADIEAWLSWAYGYPLSDMTGVERAIISIAIAEMLAYPQAVDAVVINEAIEISKRYGTDRGQALVNAVLDKVVKQQRAAD